MRLWDFRGVVELRARDVLAGFLSFSLSLSLKTNASPGRSARGTSSHVAERSSKERDKERELPPFTDLQRRRMSLNRMRTP